jgi:hypothetical protein
MTLGLPRCAGRRSLLKVIGAGVLMEEDIGG